MTARIVVDGAAYRVPAGGNLLAALDSAGLLSREVEIPHLCWHPKLSIDGSCGLCQVDVEGEASLQIACDTPVRDGLVVHTKTETVRRARERVLELLMVDHPLDCPICEKAGECALQDYAFDRGPAATRARKPQREREPQRALGPSVVLDRERCILCRRCVRFAREVPGTGELGVFGRGDRSFVDTFPGLALDNAYSMNVADVCPVGALTTADFRFKARVWAVEDVDGICTGCANGCNVHIGVSKGEIQRYVPRRNDGVNDTWMCDEGRLSYKAIGSPDRLERPALREPDGALVECSWQEAVSSAARRLRALLETAGGGVVAGVVSGYETNEDLYTFKRFLEAMETEVAGVATRLGESDDLLIRAEKAPNGTGARALGFSDASGVVERIRGGGVDGLVLLGHGILAVLPAEGRDAIASLDTVILIDTHPSELGHIAHVVLPARCAAEKDGTVTNFAGRVQRVRRAVEPAFEGRAEGEAVTRIARAMGLAGFDAPWDPRRISSELSASVPAFLGIDIDSVGDRGLVMVGFETE